MMRGQRSTFCLPRRYLTRRTNQYLLTTASLIYTLALSGCLTAKAESHPQYQLQAHESHSSPHHSEERSDQLNHHHQKVEIPAKQPVPVVDLVVHPDALKGWNLEVKLTNFRFAPESVNSNGALTEGHAHLYVNGKKLTRLYSSWYYLEDLPVGKHQVSIILNTNNHEELVYKGKPISDTEVIQVSAQ